MSKDQRGQQQELTTRQAVPYLLNQPCGTLSGQALGFAHRGAGEDENTLTAFARAAGQGFAYLETDVRMSSDGVLYALHDATMERVSDGSGAVAELSSAQLDAMTINGSAGDHPARFEALLQALPHARWNVDLKSAGSASELVRLAAKHGALDRVLVASFAASHRNQAMALSARLVGSAGPGLVAASVLLGPLALPMLRAARRRGIVAMQVPVKQGWVRVVRAAWLRRIHAAGLQAHVWVVDDPARMRELLNLGVDGLMTDNAPALSAVLAQRGEWPQTQG